MDQLLVALTHSVQQLNCILAEEQVMAQRLDASRKAAQANIKDKHAGLLVDGSTHSLQKQYSGGHLLSSMVQSLPSRPGLSPSAWSSSTKQIDMQAAVACTAPLLCLWVGG